MNLRNELLKRIEKKQAEIREFDDRIREANAYVQGLQDTLKPVSYTHLDHEGECDALASIAAALGRGSQIAS